MIKRLFWSFCANALALYLCQKLFQYLLNDFYFTVTIKQFLILTLALTLLNLLLKPILKFFFAPLIFLTLGIFSLIINLIILKVATYFVPQLVINSPLTWLGASLLISFLNSWLGSIK